MNTHPWNGNPWPVIIARHTEILGKDAPETAMCTHCIDVIMAGDEQYIECEENSQHNKCQPAFLFLHLEYVEYVHWVALINHCKGTN